MASKADALVDYGDDRKISRGEKPTQSLFEGTVITAAAEGQATTPRREGNMLTVRSESGTILAGLVAGQQQDETDPQARPMWPFGVSYAQPEQYDDCYKDEYQQIAGISRFTRAAICASAEDEYASLLVYSLDGLFFSYVTGD